jgi:phenylalanyl-tRNA synthetase beta chain
MPQRMFEIGHIFNIKDGKINEQTHLAFVSEHSKANFSEVRSMIDAIYEVTHEKYEVKEHNDPSFIEGRCAKVVIDGKEVGIFGEVHPSVLANFKIEEPVVAAELTIT